MEKGILKLTSKQLSYLSKAINAERFGQEEVNSTSRNTLTAQEHDELNENINRLLCVVKDQPLERIPEDKTVVDDSSRSDSLRLAETPVEPILEKNVSDGETKSQSGERELVPKSWEEKKAELTFYLRMLLDGFGMEVVYKGSSPLKKREERKWEIINLVTDTLEKELSESKKEGWTRGKELADLDWEESELVMALTPEKKQRQLELRTEKESLVG